MGVSALLLVATRRGRERRRVGGDRGPVRREAAAAPAVLERADFRRCAGAAAFRRRAAHARQKPAGAAALHCAARVFQLI